VALVYRLLQIVVAAIGMLIYWCSRGEVRQVMEDAQQNQERVWPDPQPENAVAGIRRSAVPGRDPPGGFSNGTSQG
ncbi:MAG: hypothetical protein R6U98_10520, partial [Pirellulaceae bacterium]